MCLAVPGKLIRWIDRDPVAGLAEIEFGGVRRPCHMACVPEAREGDYVIVHAGIALTLLDQRQADRLLADLESIPEESASSLTSSSAATQPPLPGGTRDALSE
jgi:hydrogenase expression/formation protein HypC